MKRPYFRCFNNIPIGIVKVDLKAMKSNYYLFYGRTIPNQRDFGVGKKSVTLHRQIKRVTLV